MDEKANLLGGDHKFKNPVTKLGNIEQLSRTTNRGLKNLSNRSQSELEFAATKCHYQEERIICSERHWEALGGPGKPGVHPRSCDQPQRKAQESHGGEQIDLRGFPA